MSDLFDWSGTEYNLRDFVSLYENELPQIALIRHGYCGTNDMHCYSAGEVFFILGIKTQLRIVTQDNKGRMFGIPLSFAKSLKITEAGKAYKKSIKDIIKHWKKLESPGKYQVHFTKDVNISYCQSNDSQKVLEFDQLTLQDYYEEKFLIAKPIVSDGTIGRKAIALPVYVVLLVSLAADSSRKAAYIKKAGKSDLTKIALNKEIIALPNKIVEENEYAYIEPKYLLQTYEPLTTSRLAEPKPKYSTLIKSPTSLPSQTDRQGNKPNLPLKPKLPMGRTVGNGSNNRSTRMSQKTVQNKYHINETLQGQDEYSLPYTDATQTRNINRNFNWKQFPSDRKLLTVAQVSEALRGLRLEAYIEYFSDQTIDGGILQELTTEILVKDFNFKRIDAIKLTKFANGWTPQI